MQTKRDTLLHLVDKSLIERHGQRLRLHELLRQFASEKLGFATAQTIFAAHGNLLGANTALLVEGYVHLMLGDLQRAKTQLETACAALEQIDSHYGLSRALITLGLILQAIGDFPQAITIHKRALTMLQQLNAIPYIAPSLVGLGMATLAADDYMEAERYFTDTVNHCHRH